MTRISGFGKTKIGLLQFLGSNCDVDCVDALKRKFDIDVQPIWHTETSLPPLDGLIIPGGFSYGDFLRGGALASHCPILEAVKGFVKRGGALIGICNGFQILTESHILPGALLMNQSGEFVCKHVELMPAAGSSGYHRALNAKTLSIPIAHGEGRYFISLDGLKTLHDHGQIILRYGDNPNGSIDNIAGIVSRNGRVLGMMPHPERATEKLLGGSEDGLFVWQSFLESCM